MIVYIYIYTYIPIPKQDSKKSSVGKGLNPIGVSIPWVAYLVYIQKRPPETLV